MSKHCGPHFPRQDTEVRPRPQQHASTSERRHSMDPQSSGEVQALREQVRVLAAGLGIDGEYEVPEEARREARAAVQAAAIRELRRRTPGRPRPATNDTAKAGQAKRPTASKRVNSPPAGASPRGRTSPAQSKQQASKQQRGSLLVWLLGALPLIISPEHAGGMAVEVLSQSEPGRRHRHRWQTQSRRRGRRSSRGRRGCRAT